MQSVASYLAIRAASGDSSGVDLQLFGPLGGHAPRPHTRPFRFPQSRRANCRYLQEKPNGGCRTMRSQFGLRALAIITLLLGEVSFLHAQDWHTVTRKQKQVIHSFDYRESNR